MFIYVYFMISHQNFTFNVEMLSNINEPLFLCAYIRIYMYLHICVSVYIYIHIYTQVYTHMETHIYSEICVNS